MSRRVHVRFGLAHLRRCWPSQLKALEHDEHVVGEAQAAAGEVSAEVVPVPG